MNNQVETRYFRPESYIFDMFNKYLLTLINVHTCKHVNGTSTHRRLSGFTDMSMCRRVPFRSSSIMSLSGRYNSGDHHSLNHDTSAFTVDNAPKMALFLIHFYMGCLLWNMYRTYYSFCQFVFINAKDNIY